MERCERVLQIAERIGATTLAFWNVRPSLKLALAKVLEVRPIRIVDVSPGPMLRRELLSAGDYPRRVSLSVAEYFARVDCFVSKYAMGLPTGHRERPPESGPQSSRTASRCPAPDLRPASEEGA